MPTTALELQTRTSNLLRALQSLLASVGGEQRGQKLAGNIIKACKEMDAGYRHACASSSPDEFVTRISHVSRNAKRTKATLMLLTQLDYVAISETRELILEIRGLDDIFRAALNRARRRYREEGVSRRNPSTRAARASRKGIPKGQKSAWGDEVGPHASTDKSP